MKKLDIVYEDKHIIIINKEPHLLTVSTANEKEKTLFHQVLLYERKKNKNNKVFIVHRLDRDTSGLVIFAKSIEVKNFLQENWEKTTRIYTAVVEGSTKESGTIKSWLKENKALITFSSDKPNDGKLAITKYKKLAQSKSYSLLEIDIMTGRKNQIRVHMQDNNTPIIGDKKYQAKTNPLKRLGLCASKIEFIHPITKKNMIIEIKPPQEFLKMFNLK
ncbi:MAG: RNA pseudouridine synthase [Bacilli bacterium]|nr:RNA pseudouridine synthase [Bacilli bacterium]